MPESEIKSERHLVADLLALRCKQWGLTEEVATFQTNHKKRCFYGFKWDDMRENIFGDVHVFSATCIIIWVNGEPEKFDSPDVAHDFLERFRRVKISNEARVRSNQPSSVDYTKNEEW
jgi:hypothetical protein